MSQDPAAGLTDPRMVDFVRQYRRAWAERDLTQMGDLWLDDGIASHPETPEPKRGRDAILAYVGQLLEMAPDLTVEPLAAAANGDVLFVHFRTHATLGGKKLSWEGIDVFELPSEGTRAARGVGYYDTAALRDALLGDDPRVAGREEE